MYNKVSLLENAYKLLDFEQGELFTVDESPLENNKWLDIAFEFLLKYCTFAYMFGSAVTCQKLSSYQKCRIHTTSGTIFRWLENLVLLELLLRCFCKAICMLVEWVKGLRARGLLQQVC